MARGPVSSHFDMDAYAQRLRRFLNARTRINSVLRHPYACTPGITHTHIHGGHLPIASHRRLRKARAAVEIREMYAWLRRPMSPVSRQFDMDTYAQRLHEAERKDAAERGGGAAPSDINKLADT